MITMKIGRQIVRSGPYKKKFRSTCLDHIVLLQVTAIPQSQNHLELLMKPFKLPMSILDSFSRSSMQLNNQVLFFFFGKELGMYPVGEVQFPPPHPYSFCRNRQQCAQDQCDYAAAFISFKCLDVTVMLEIQFSLYNYLRIGYSSRSLWNSFLPILSILQALSRLYFNESWF